MGMGPLAAPLNTLKQICILSRLLGMWNLRLPFLFYFFCNPRPALAPALETETETEGAKKSDKEMKTVSTPAPCAILFSN